MYTKINEMMKIQPAGGWPKYHSYYLKKKTSNIHQRNYIYMKHQDPKLQSSQKVVAAFTGKFFRDVKLPQQKPQDDGVLFPAVLSPNHNTDSTAVEELRDFEEAIRAQKPWLESLLQKSGAIIFRGFAVSSPSDFDRVVEAFSYAEFPYLGGIARRTKVVGRVYTANESPLHMGIPFHHEMSYVPDFPTKVFFYCDEEPGEGGETPIVLSHIIYEKMKKKNPQLVALLEQHGLTYTEVISDEDDSSSFTGRSWKSKFKTDDKNVAEETAAKLGIKIEWIGNAAKATTGPLPAVRFDKESRRKTWFNPITTTYSGSAGKLLSVEIGNGDPLPDDAVEDYRKILEEECVAIPWKKGDVLLINNLMVLHSRRPLLKPPRRILASLCK
ncbi:clavaminate synthase-like protein At3g21360 [Lactuca sativa]|uniref:TauD/TfdA-like domain-containing protein n=1 Tax=Lactuca sativa TaxID=4236 RepID=A0A9R1VWL7_LACSA|nr:clavaminate synthase-like protein At3g21360 [Lactuca sativa]KAJ0213946.1 hypothetical protein LSAT_V11C400196060 [Lactuca sativa]